MKHGLAGSALVVALITPASAHEWYPRACCNERDCFEVSADDLTLTETDQGWGYVYAPTGEFIPWDRVRETPDEAGGTFHVCTWGGDPAADIIGKHLSKGACVWIPRRGG